MNKFAFFDLDNTLVDQAGALTEWAHGFVTGRGLDPASVDWFAVKANGSNSWLELSAQIKAHFGLPDTVEELMREVTESYPKLFVLEDGVAEGLAMLRARGWKLAVVTNGRTGMQSAKIDRVDLWARVDAVFISEAEGVSKPDRAIFERAAKGLGIELGRGGWMVGDTLDADIEGGIAAGLRTIWLNHGRVRPEGAPVPDYECASVAEAIQLIVTE